VLLREIDPNPNPTKVSRKLHHASAKAMRKTRAQWKPCGGNFTTVSSPKPSICTFV
jgi:hypothetical protein